MSVRSVLRPIRHCAFLLATLATLLPAARLRTVSDGTLTLDGKPWRGIGVNCFDAFLRHLRDSANTSYDRAFRTLDSLGIPFSRLSFSGFYAKDMGLYLSDKEAYFRRLDRVVESARTHHVGLVPSILWNQKLASEMMSQPVDSFNDTASATGRWARQYTREVVERYRGDPTIWAWEIGNEYYPFGDLPGTSVYHTPTTTRAVRDHFLSIAGTIRSLDPDRPITSGNQAPTRNQYHRYLFRTDSVLHPDYNTTDSLSEHLRVLDMLHPDPIDMISSHVYPFGSAGGYFRERKPTADEIAYIQSLREIGASLGKPVFLGEFGVNDQSPDRTGTPFDSAGQVGEFQAMLDAITQTGLPMAAVWVFDYGGQSPAGEVSVPGTPFWNITPTNKRSYQLRLLAEANRGLSSVGRPHRAKPVWRLVHGPQGSLVLQSSQTLLQSTILELRDLSGALLRNHSGLPGPNGWNLGATPLPRLVLVRVRTSSIEWESFLVTTPVR